MSRNARYCCAINCSNNSATSTDIRTQRPVRFHQFPDPVKEKERCSKWIINLRRADLHLKNIRHKSVCSVHFELNAYNCPIDIATSRLLPSAVPTLIACPNPPRLSASCRPPPKKRCVDTSESINLEAETHCADSDPTEDESTSNGTKTESGEDKLLKLEKELAKAKLALKHYQSRNKLLCRQVKRLRAANEKCVTKELALHSKLEKAIKFNLENFLKQLPPLPSALISVLLKKAKKVSWKKEPQGVGLCPSLLKMIHLRSVALKEHEKHITLSLDDGRFVILRKLLTNILLNVKQWFQCLKHTGVADATFIFSATTMSSTSKKHQNFVTEPMGDKLVTELAGIGDVLGKRLSEANYDKAYTVLGQFLLFKKDEELFKEWLHDASGANAKQQKDCYQCIKEWCDSFL
ncbi:hypothetical protein EGW08_006561 [Elysia chlorotica]|uniref:Barrier-to-autointegration factor-like protein n=1 Tax=Elysia chlorotica TaxID=188477 RepID=A0A3S1BK86_ELYCH|nr:hypothetical protein EGW08_006561 [Elysia chlorotica]